MPPGALDLAQLLRAHRAEGGTADAEDALHQIHELARAIADEVPAIA